MQDPLLRQWAAVWASAERELAELERQELAAMTHEQAAATALALLSLPLPPELPERSSSGLVEQQRWFAKLRER